ncbi:hypothetical protein MFUL124B02_11400 [Myxococcus fulvus 124B02]|nr:hypothetical protein MFUL124B02_11400 [Myxococcus fulvus 124B02]
MFQSVMPSGLELPQTSGAGMGRGNGSQMDVSNRRPV